MDGPEYSSSDGLHIIEQGSQDPVVDFIAVHGLAANPEYTWIKKADDRNPIAGVPENVRVRGTKREVMWLKHLLPQKIPEARILKFNYDSSYLINAPKENLWTIAERLVQAIHDLRSEEKTTMTRPIIFLGHSFGGNVIQEAIVYAQTMSVDGVYRHIVHNTHGVIFLGTPFRGSAASVWGAALAGWAKSVGVGGHTTILDTLREGSERLELLLKQFLVIAKRPDPAGDLGEMKLVCFYETMCTWMGKYGIGKNLMVVDQQSGSIDGYESVSLHVDHSQMNKYASSNDAAFKIIASKARELLLSCQSRFSKRDGFPYTQEDAHNKQHSGNSLTAKNPIVPLSYYPEPRCKVDNSFDYLLQSIPRTLENEHQNDIHPAGPLAQSLKIDDSEEQINGNFYIPRMNPAIAKRQKRERVKGLKWLEWLSPQSVRKTVDPGKEKEVLVRIEGDLEARLRLYQEGTGQWLFKEIVFQDWISGKSTYRTLYCPGKAGAGKTVMAALVIQYLNDMAKKGYHIGFGFVFCSYKERTSQLPLMLIRSLIRQLAQQLVTRPWVKEATRKKCLEELEVFCEPFESLEPRLEDLSNFFQRFVACGFTNVYFVIDAIDECTPQTRNDLVHHLKALVSNVENLNLLVTSRKLDNIAAWFPTAPSITIEARKDDMQRYLERRIDRAEFSVLLGTQKDRLEQEKQVIIEEIIKISGGMFLLAKLHIRNLDLDTKNTFSEIKDALRNLSTGDGADTSTAYDHTLARIDEQSPQNRDLAKRILKWIVYAYRPLFLEELQHALLIEDSKSEPPQIVFSSDSVYTSSKVVSICAGLVEIDENGIAHMVHATAQDYCLRRFKTQDPTTPLYIGRACIRYLRLDGFQKFLTDFATAREQASRYPFAQYASQYWGHHFNSYEGVEDEDKTLEQEIDYFLSHEKNIAYAIDLFTLRIFANNLAKEVEATDMEGAVEMSNACAMKPLYAKCIFGLNKIATVDIKDIIFNDDRPEAPKFAGKFSDTHHDLISISSYYGNVKFAQHLLASEYYPLSTMHSSLEHAIFVCAYNCKENDDVESERLLEELVVKHQRLPRQAGGQATIASAVNSAAERGNWKIMKSLLSICDVKADVVQEVWGAISPLELAVDFNHHTIIHELLEFPKYRPELRRTGGKALVKEAGGRARSEILDLLLQRFADRDILPPDKKFEDHFLNAKDNTGRTPLYAALETSNTKLAEKLIAMGADSTAANNQLFTCLHMAALKGLIEIVKTLLKPGVDVEMQSEHGATPLYVAAMSGHRGIVLFLLERGANAKTCTKEKWTPLHAAATKTGRADIVRDLLDLGREVDLEARTEMGATPLHIAASSDNEEVFSLLMSKGADPAAVATNGATPLHRAAQCGNETMVRLLLGRGVDHDTTAAQTIDGQSLTPLHYAATNGHGRIVAALLEGGADLKKVSSDGFLPLHFAAQWGHLEIVRILLHHTGFTEHFIDAQSNDGSTPIYLAACQGQKEVVRYLLNWGADPTIRTQKRRNAIHAAAKGGHEEIFDDLLLTNCANIDDEDEVRSPAIATEPPQSRTAPSPTVGRTSDAIITEMVNLVWEAIVTTPLSLAASKGYVSIVRKLLAHGAAPCGKLIDSGWAPINVAAFCGHKAVVELLLKKGVSVDWKDPQGNTPLLYAALGGNLEIVRLLLESEADPNASGSHHVNSPLYISAQGGYVRITMELLAWKANPLEIFDTHRSVLHVAAARGHTEVVRVLLDWGVEVDMRCTVMDVQYTPLFYAARDGHPEVVKLLLKRGADSKRCVTWRRGWKSSSALFAAAFFGRTKIIEILLDHGDEPDPAIGLTIRYIDSGPRPESPLLLAALNGHVEVVKLLLKHQVKIDRNSFSYGSPLNAAAMSGHVGIVNLLIDHGADPSEFKRIPRSTPLHTAVANGHTEVVKILLTRGKDEKVDAWSFQVDQGRTALHIAADQGKSEIIKLLLSHGAQTDMCPSTIRPQPLHVAILKGDLKAVEALLTQGANPRAFEMSRLMDCGTFQALHTAAHCGNVTIVQRLLNCPGVHPDDRSTLPTDNTALGIAVAAGAHEVARLLLSYKEVNPNFSGSGKYSLNPPVNIAVWRNDIEMMRLLLERQDLDIEKPFSLMVTPTQRDWSSPREMAMDLGYLEMAVLLRVASEQRSRGSDKSLDIVSLPEPDLAAAEVPSLQPQMTPITINNKRRREGELGDERAEPAKLQKVSEGAEGVMVDGT